MKPEEREARQRIATKISHIGGELQKILDEEYDHFRITDLGKDYLKLRREVVSES
jgi:hypothetical protein